MSVNSQRLQKSSGWAGTRQPCERRQRQRNPADDDDMPCWRKGAGLDRRGTLTRATRRPVSCGGVGTRRRADFVRVAGHGALPRLISPDRCAGSHGQGPQRTAANARIQPPPRARCPPAPPSPPRIQPRQASQCTLPCPGLRRPLPPPSRAWAESAEPSGRMGSAGRRRRRLRVGGGGSVFLSLTSVGGVGGTIGPDGLGRTAARVGGRRRLRVCAAARGSFSGPCGARLRRGCFTSGRPLLRRRAQRALLRPFARLEGMRAGDG